MEDIIVTDDSPGVALNPARVSRRFRRFMAELGMDTIPFKICATPSRPCTSTPGVSDKTLSEAMGHSRRSTTNTYYRRVDRRHQQAAADRLSALLHQAAQTDVAGGTPETDTGQTTGQGLNPVTWADEYSDPTGRARLVADGGGLENR